MKFDSIMVVSWDEDGAESAASDEVWLFLAQDIESPRVILCVMKRCLDV